MPYAYSRYYADFKYEKSVSHRLVMFKYLKKYVNIVRNMTEKQPCCDYGHYASSSQLEPGVLKLFPLGGSDKIWPTGKVALVLCKDHWQAEIANRKTKNILLRTGTKWHLPDWNMAQRFDADIHGSVSLDEQVGLEDG